MTSPWVDGEMLNAATMYSRTTAITNGMAAQLVDTGWVDTTTNGVIITAAAGVATFGRATARRLGASVSFTYLCTLVSALTVGTNGNVTDTTIGTFGAAWTTTNPATQILGGYSPPLPAGLISGGNQIVLTAVATGSTLAAGTSLAIGGTYLL
jgi:hypothetical protein